jgi:imidazoleglycerol-phosphate dehydratase
VTSLEKDQTEAKRVTRASSKKRETKETSIQVNLDLDGDGEVTADTGLPFFDHMLSQLGRHAGFNLLVKADGDLDVDAHHSVEDVGIVLGECLNDALGDRSGIQRFSSLSVPLDEALVAVALDISGRPYLDYLGPIAQYAPVL